MVPPLVGVAVKVTLVPEQIDPFGFAAILTLAGNAELTDIVIGLEAAGDPVTHVKLDVTTQVITLPLARVVEV